MTDKNKIILHSDFKHVINDINKIRIRPITKPYSSELDFSNTKFPPDGKITLLEPFGKYELDAQIGQHSINKYVCCGYDESKLMYKALEGQAHLTAHSMIYVGENDFEPINYISYYFYTRSNKISSESSSLTLTDDPISKSNLDYVTDRNYFLKNWSIENSILFIDGPLIGGNISKYTVDLVKDLHEKNIIPIFFIKNSDSNLVTDNSSDLINKYNSDLHWAFDFLRIGERTNLYMYSDEHHPKEFAKVFCYIKPFNISPQRIELHITTYTNFKDHLNDIFNLIYYLLIVQGDIKNPQIRPIAIAEKFAREVISITDQFTQIKYAGLTPIMNQVRFNE
jgi:hypothetical protein